MNLRRRPLIGLVVLGMLACNLLTPDQADEETPAFFERPAMTAAPPLGEVRSWLYLIDAGLDEAMLATIAASSYDMVVLDLVSSQSDQQGFDMPGAIARLHSGAHPKRVLAYLNAGQAEDYRTYWQPGWRVGSPDWIASPDPDGWSGNYPVAFWREEWRQVWMGEQGLLAQTLAAGYDGVYLDWLEAYTDESVLALAQKDGLDARQAMVSWVQAISQALKARCPDCTVLAQNAAALAGIPAYREAIDGIAQEQVWFDGGANNDPPGDCPLPRRAADVDTIAYRDSLSPACRHYYDSDPQSTLHSSSDEYLGALLQAQQHGLLIFTVDYALEPENVRWVYETSRSHGFIPFAGSRNLSRFIEPQP